ncbi:MAG: hypothetical protein DI639_03750 [Leifsonia xyli]|nr:MAG: hypothetical protein DI639_03750 [Leifsonia xyli]
MTSTNRASLWLVLAGVAVAVATVWVTTREPALGVALTVVILSAIWAARQPRRVAVTLAFLTALFPKAGLKIGDFPLPVFLFGLVAAVILAVLTRPRKPHSPIAVVLLILWLAFVVSRAIVLAGASLSGALAFAAWTAGPVFILFIATMSTDVQQQFVRAVEIGFVCSVGYGAIQLFGGVEGTAVPGLTYAFGDDLTEKNNVIYSETGPDYSKIPSTYQNGNIYGLVAAGMFALALNRVVRQHGSRFDFVLLAASCAAIALSGSRTAIVAAVAVAIVVFLSSGRVGRKLSIVMVVSAVAAAIVTLQPGLVDRYSIDDVLDSGGAGRTEMWRAALATTPLGDYWLGAPTDPGLEGWLGLVLRLGLLGIALLVAIVAVLVRGRTELRLPLLVLAVGAILDSSYLLFPTWFLFAAVAIKAGGVSRALSDHGARGETRSVRQSASTALNPVSHTPRSVSKPSPHLRSVAPELRRNHS